MRIKSTRTDFRLCGVQDEEILEEAAIAGLAACREHESGRL